MRQLYPILAILICLIACTPKVVEPIVEPPKPVVEAPTEPQNPCRTLGKLTPAQRDIAETAYVLYKDNVKVKKYELALPDWKKAYEMAPAANGRIKYQFDDGVAIYKYLYSQAQDVTLQKAYMDTVMQIYDKRIECFGEEPYVQGRKGFDLYYVFNQHASEEEAFELFKSAIDGKGEEADYFILNPFSKMIYDRVLDKRMSLEEGHSYAQKILQAVNYGVANCEKNCEAWEIVNGYSPQRLEDLEGLKGFYPCQYYVDKFFPQFQANPEDCDNIDDIYRKLLWGQCDQANAQVMELSAAKKTSCYTPPPPPGPLKTAYNFLDAGQFNEAITKFEEFVNKTTDIEKKAKYTMVVSKIYYVHLKDFTKSRRAALKAAEFKPNWGEPYMLIGKLYASSGPRCGPGTGWDSQIVTWPAIDKFKYAKKVDPSAAAEANEWIGKYRKYMPSKEDVFIRNLKVGSSFKVGCWIQENTTIRTP